MLCLLVMNWHWVALTPINATDKLQFWSDRLSSFLVSTKKRIIMSVPIRQELTCLSQTLLVLYAAIVQRYLACVIQLHSSLHVLVSRRAVNQFHHDPANGSWSLRNVAFSPDRLAFLFSQTLAKHAERFVLSLFASTRANRFFGLWVK